MASKKPETEALAKTISLYGEVFRAREAFENDIHIFLQSFLLRYRDTFDGASIEFRSSNAEPLKERTPYGYWIHASLPLKRLGRTNLRSATWAFGFGWRRAPETERQALPFAHIEIAYDGDDGKGDLRAIFKAVQGSLPAGLYAETSKTLFELMFEVDKSEEHYRDALGDLESDLVALVAGLGAALKAVGAA